MAKPKSFDSWEPEKQEEWREKERARYKIYHAANPEKVAEKGRKWRAANPEKVAESNRKHRQLQRELRNASATLAMFQAVKELSQLNPKPKHT